MEWADGNPFFLLLVSDDGENVQIDLGVTGWAKTHAGWMRQPGWWYLARKDDGFIVAMIRVNPGDQPYYVAKHVGYVGANGEPGAETIVYGIGKKRPDGHTDRLWVMSTGTYTVGDDIEFIASTLLKQGHL